MATVAYGSQATTVTLANSNGHHESAEEEQYFSTFFCRALYDYQTDNESSLSFRRDDIIEVLTKLESGWWDGLLGQERGWFPSNYVAVISYQEADAAFSTTEAVSGIMHPQFAEEVDVSNGLPVHHGWEQQLELNETPPRYSSHDEQHNSSTPLSHSDFWVPQVSSDGRIYYMNTQTGQQSLDLPLDNQDMSNSNLTGFSVQSNSLNTVLGLSATSSFPSVNGHSEIGNEGFGAPLRTGTPEPWKKILADDGMSYYFLNTFDGTVSWTLPSANPVASGGPGVHAQMKDSIRSLTINNSDEETATLVSSTITSPFQRLRSGSSTSYTKDRDYNSDDRYSIHSDDSDIQPPPRQRSESSISSKRRGTNDSVVVISPLKTKSRTTPKAPDPTHAEQVAQSLQQVLVPPPPASVNELSVLARESILAVVQYIQSHDVWVHQRYAQELNEQVLTVVNNVRNLLYVSATPSGHIPSNLYSRHTRNGRPTSDAQSLQAHLKPAQRKVAGTLSKIVLSTLAILYDSNSPSADNPLRMEADASELERAILAFVVEVQRFFNQSKHASDKDSIKRLYGAFLPQNIGLGLLGAGAAGGWKGFGWMALGETDDAPHRLSGEVVSELKTLVSNVEAKRVQFIDASTDHAKPHSVLARECQEFIRRLYACVTFVCNIHVARHVDVDGINADKGHALNRDLYLQTVDKARRLVRTLEVAVQAVYDDGASFLLLAQGIRPQGAGSSPWVALVSLSSSLKQSLDFVVQSCEALLSVGHNQAELGQGDYNGSIEWRMSRISIVDQFGDILWDAAKASKALEKDVIDAEIALRRPETKTKVSSDVVSSDVDDSPIFHRNQSQTSEALLESGVESDINMPIIPQRLDAKISTSPSDGPPVLQLYEAALFDDEGPAAASKAPPKGEKLRKLLGDDAPQAYIDKVNADLKKWYLRSDHPPGDLKTDPEGTVRGGTVQALVERLTTHDAADLKFNTIFLMTYKSFTTTDDLFELLVQRFWIQPPDGINPQELEEWKKLKQHVVRLRVLNIFKAMIVDVDILESDDAYIFQRMKEFASTEAVVGLPAAKQLISQIEQMQQGDDVRVTTMTVGSVPPPPIIPKAKSKLKIADIDPLEMARQLTLMESQLYQKIRPIECLQRSRDQRGDNSDNISAVIQFANRMANWVADSVLVKEDSRRRAAVIKSLIHVADRCRALHNFSSMIAIVSGLNTTPIRRLKRTWEQVPARFMTLLSTCETLIDSNKNFGNYRDVLAQISPPCVPFIGVFLTQLTFINENLNTIGPNLVNFSKRQRTAEVILDIKRWQSTPYNFHPVASIVNFVEEALAPFGDGQDFSDHFWNLSLEREPREREDEKMARLLQESGFL